MNYIEAENAVWKWDGKYVELHRLHNNKLKHIINFVDKYRGYHFGKNSEYWFNACNMVIKGRLIYDKISDIFKKDMKHLNNNYY